MIELIREQAMGVMIMDTIGQRIKLEMIHKDLKQADILRQLHEKGIEIQKSQMSKIVNDEVSMFTPAMLIEIARIIGVDTHYLLTGEERGDTKSWSDEAAAVAAIVDKASDPLSRSTLLSVIEKVTQLHPEHWEFMLSVISNVGDKVGEIDKARRRLAGKLYDERRGVTRSVQGDLSRSTPGNGC